MADKMSGNDMVGYIAEKEKGESLADTELQAFFWDGSVAWEDRENLDSQDIQRMKHLQEWEQRKMGAQVETLRKFPTGEWEATVALWPELSRSGQATLPPADQELRARANRQYEMRCMLRYILTTIHEKFGRCLSERIRPDEYVFADDESRKLANRFWNEQDVASQDRTLYGILDCIYKAMKYTDGRFLQCLENIRVRYVGRVGTREGCNDDQEELQRRRVVSAADLVAALLPEPQVIGGHKTTQVEVATFFGRNAKVAFDSLQQQYRARLRDAPVLAHGPDIIVFLASLLFGGPTGLRKMFENEHVAVEDDWETQWMSLEKFVDALDGYANRARSTKREDTKLTCRNLIAHFKALREMACMNNPGQAKPQSSPGAAHDPDLDQARTPHETHVPMARSPSLPRESPTPYGSAAWFVPMFENIVTLMHDQIDKLVITGFEDLKLTYTGFGQRSAETGLMCRKIDPGEALRRITHMITHGEHLNEYLQECTISYSFRLHPEAAEYTSKPILCTEIAEMFARHPLRQFDPAILLSDTAVRQDLREAQEQTLAVIRIAPFLLQHRNWFALFAILILPWKQISGILSDLGIAHDEKWMEHSLELGAIMYQDKLSDNRELNAIGETLNGLRIHLMGLADKRSSKAVKKVTPVVKGKKRLSDQRAGTRDATPSKKVKTTNDGDLKNLREKATDNGTSKKGTGRATVTAAGPSKTTKRTAKLETLGTQNIRPSNGASE